MVAVIQEGEVMAYSGNTYDSTGTERRCAKSERYIKIRSRGATASLYKRRMMRRGGRGGGLPSGVFNDD